MKFDVMGIGNPLMDMLIKVDHDILAELNLKNGSMHLVSSEDVDKIHSKINAEKFKLSPGGSVANTMAGIALLGGKVLFCGKVGNDEHGSLYEDHMRNSGVNTKLVKTPGFTGKAITFITPDSERTFATHLGVACDLKKHEVMEEDIVNSKFLHVTGYQLENPIMRETTLNAMDIAKNNGVKISIDLADPNLIERNLSDLTDIAKRYADILLMNEEEAKAFTGEEAERALEKSSELADIAIVKLGEKGSLIRQANNIVRINSHKANAVDTTGAGDMYAAGFLYALSQGKSLKIAGNTGSYVSAKVVEQVGARLDKISKEDVEKIENDS